MSPLLMRRAKPRSIWQLSKIEHQVAELVIEGFGDIEIGEQLDRSTQVVKNTLRDLYERFEIEEDDTTKRVSLALYLHAHLDQFGLHCIRCA